MDCSASETNDSRLVRQQSTEENLVGEKMFPHPFSKPPKTNNQNKIDQSNGFFIHKRHNVPPYSLASIKYPTDLLLFPPLWVVPIRTFVPVCVCFCIIFILFPLTKFIEAKIRWVARWAERMWVSVPTEKSCSSHHSVLGAGVWHVGRVHTQLLLLLFFSFHKFFYTTHTLIVYFGSYQTHKHTLYFIYQQQSIIKFYY